MAQPSTLYSSWQLEVILTNMRDLKLDLTKVILLFDDTNKVIVDNLREKYGVLAFVYSRDNMPQDAKSYLPSIRPFLWAKFLKDHEEFTKEQFIYQDSDIIYLEPLDESKFSNLSPTNWYACDVESYVGPDYLNSKGTDILERMSNFLELASVDDMWSFKTRAVGAHWVIDSPSAEYWQEVYDKSYKMYKWLHEIEHEYDYALEDNGGTQESFVQIWCSEMYSELYLCKKYGITTEPSEELGFRWVTDYFKNHEDYTDKIVHNSGVTKEIKKDRHIFRKQDFLGSNPLNEDLSKYRDESAFIYKYIEAMEKVQEKEQEKEEKEEE